jgi:4-hydroxy-4-methyl-2-oxoglutarate aldolase
MTAPNMNRLAQYPTATIHEAYGGKGAFPSMLRPIDPARRLFGRAFTVEAAAGDNLWIHRALLAAAEGDVLVCSVAGAYEHGYWGEILTVAAMVRGIAGLVIDGGIRDADRIEALGFPVFCLRLCIRGTTKHRDAPGRLGEPLMFGDCLVKTGDLVVGDRDGLVAVDAVEIESVLKAAAEREAKEASVMKRLRAGETTMEIFGWE